MIDNQGRGNFIDESRIEKMTSRPLENYTFDTSNKVNNILNQESSMSQNTQSIQKQIDCCRDFCIAIDYWINLNKKAIEELQKGVSEAFSSNTLAEFRSHMTTDWQLFDQYTQESMQLLSKSKAGFQSIAKGLIDAQNAFGGQKVNLNNNVDDGFTDNLKKHL